MGAVSGFQGDVAVGSVEHVSEYNVYEWSMDIRSDIFRYIVFGATSFGRRAHAGGYRATGRLLAYWESTATAKLLASNLDSNRGSVVLTLTANTGRTYVFPAHLHNYEFRVNKNTGLNTLDTEFHSAAPFTSIT